MLKTKVDAIIFDVDGTFTNQISWLKLSEGLGASTEQHRKIFNAMLEGKISYPDAKKQLIELWKNTGNANKKYFSKLFSNWPLKEYSKELIEYLKPNYKLCLISGSVDVYVSIVANKLGITDWYANTELIWDDNENLIDFNYFVDQAEKKNQQFNEYLNENKLDINRCAVVGDGDSDIVLFKQSKYGIEVHNEEYKELHKYAYATIVELEELKKIF